MNIHINRSVNKELEKNELNINIESSENNNEVVNLIEYIKEYSNNKIVVYDGYNMIQVSINEIMYFYSEGNYNFCKTKDKEYRVKSKKSFDIGENRNIIVRFNDNSEQFVSRRKIKEVMNYLDERMM